MAADGTEAGVMLAAADANAALDELFPLVYAQLERVARRRLASEREGHTLSTTGLVHEVYLRLIDQPRASTAERTRFFALAARAMRRILVDYARQHHAQRRGGSMRRVTLDESSAVALTDRADEL